MFCYSGLFTIRSGILCIITASLIQMSACLTTGHEVAGSVPGTSTNLNVD